MPGNSHVEFVTASWRSINAEEVALLHIFSPFVIGFLASRLFFGWVSRAGFQSVGFSPTVASILTTPILAVCYYLSVIGDFFSGEIRNAMMRLLMSTLFFIPILLILPPLLVLYLRGTFRRRTLTNLALCAATAACLCLEGVWLGDLIQDS
jgi:uncharacterized membrane protein YqaE (UPF0057 family)